MSNESNEALEQGEIPLVFIENDDGEAVGLVPLPERFNVEEFEYDLTENGILIQFVSTDGGLYDLPLAATDEQLQKLDRASGLIVAPPSSIDFVDQDEI